MLYPLSYWSLIVAARPKQPTRHLQYSSRDIPAQAGRLASRD